MTHKAVMAVLCLPCCAGEVVGKLLVVCCCVCCRFPLKD